jgi:hypothetical protein
VKNATNPYSRFKVSPNNYRVIQYPGGFPSIWDLKMSLLGDRLHERPGFSSFLVTFFFSFHKKKKKVTKRFEMKEELEFKNKFSL